LFVAFAGKKQPEQVGKMPEIRQKLNLEVMAWNTGTGVHYGGTTP